MSFRHILKYFEKNDKKIKKFESNLIFSPIYILGGNVKDGISSILKRKIQNRREK